jgi:hypothetical protein
MTQFWLRAIPIGLALMAGVLEAHAGGAAIAFCRTWRLEADPLTSTAHGLSDDLAPTIELARKQALETCIARGGDSKCCNIVGETESGCVAIALNARSTPNKEHSRRREFDPYSYDGEAVYGIGKGPDMESAREAALRECDEGFPGSCVPLGVRCVQ